VLRLDAQSVATWAGTVATRKDLRSALEELPNDDARMTIVLDTLRDRFDEKP
jgi:hypothetical protein